MCMLVGSTMIACNATRRNVIHSACSMCIVHSLSLYDITRRHWVRPNRKLENVFDYS